MSNIAAKQDDVTSATDGLFKTLLDKAKSSEDLDFALSVAQAATRYLAVKSRINLPEDEGHSFDEYRRSLEQPGAGPPAAAAGRSDAGVPSGGEPIEQLVKQPRKRRTSARVDADRGAPNNGSTAAIPVPASADTSDSIGSNGNGTRRTLAGSGLSL